MKKLLLSRFILVVAVIIGCYLVAGCSGGNSNADTASLHGDWSGVHKVGGKSEPLQLVGDIKHEAGSNEFTGSMTVNGEEYNLKGTIENDDVKAVLTNSTSTINWIGKYINGRIKGTYTHAATSPAKVVSATVDAAPASGTFDLVKFLNIQGNITMGPWLLYSQDNTRGLASMTIRIGVEGSENSVTATVTGTDPATGSKINYGAVTMSNYFEAEGVNMYEHTFDNLPSNSLFSYIINITDSKKAKYSVNATFRTPPSRADIESGRVTSQVFFGMGDNRRELTSASDNLPMVEENMIAYGGIMSDTNEQSCIIHCGDAVSLGNKIDTLYLARYYGWKNEWLKSSNDTPTTDKYNHDYRYHTWMRASMPTFMAPGNHEGYSGLISMDSHLDNSSLELYGKLMTNPAVDHVVLPNGYNSYTYMADYGGMRVISLNTYYCFNQDDVTAITNKLTTWVNEAYPGGPVILVVHPSPYGSGYQPDKENGNYYFAKMANLQDYFKKLFAGKKNVIVISGHVHETARAFQDGINYYVLGTGGAEDMNYGDAYTKTVTTDSSIFGSSYVSTTYYDVDSFVKLSNYTGPPTKQKISDCISVANSQGQGPSCVSKDKDYPQLQNIYKDFAFAKFTVDYRARQVKAVIYGAKDGDKGKVIDINSWQY